ncbi:MAG: hypothetical protein Ta2G_13700 [Termitinemataceae bacterium]|nr:MAG: hypothetical protein Ta2G_13700 [Termitinemataceae bacterium]
MSLKSKFDSYKKNILDFTQGENGVAIIRLSLLCAIMAYFPMGARPLYVVAQQLDDIIALSKSDKSDKSDKDGLDSPDGEAIEVFSADDVGGALYAEDGLAENGVMEPESFSAPQMLLYTSYTMESGDMIGKLAERTALDQGTLISVNNIKNTRAIQAGKSLLIPNQDGIMHKMATGETLSLLAEKYKIEVSSIVTANELFDENVTSDLSIFLPGAKLDYSELQEINGDLFIWPISSRRITSRYGYRKSPITGARGFHSGLDIGAPTGVPIRSAMPGRVTTTGWSNVFGNYVVVSHHSGYRTLYAHMSVITAKSGAYVDLGQKIGEVGNTGQSTGPHLHFQVYKDGRTVNPTLLMH